MRRKDREIIDIKEIEAIIDKADVCRIALGGGDMPYIVALNFGYKRGDPSKIYFHCASSGKKLDLIAINNNTCFQMDIDHQLVVTEKSCNFSMNYKSVVGFGKIYIVEDENEKYEGMKTILKHYSDRDDFEFNDELMLVTTILRLEISEMTGKRKV